MFVTVLVYLLALDDIRNLLSWSKYTYIRAEQRLVTRVLVASGLRSDERC